MPHRAASLPPLGRRRRRRRHRANRRSFGPPPEPLILLARARAKPTGSSWLAGAGWLWLAGWLAGEVCAHRYEELASETTRLCEPDAKGRAPITFRWRAVHRKQPPAARLARPGPARPGLARGGRAEELPRAGAEATRPPVRGNPAAQPPLVPFAFGALSGSSGARLSGTRWGRDGRRCNARRERPATPPGPPPPGRRGDSGCELVEFA